MEINLKNLMIALVVALAIASAIDSTGMRLFLEQTISDVLDGLTPLFILGFEIAVIVWVYRFIFLKKKSGGRR